MGGMAFGEIIEPKAGHILTFSLDKSTVRVLTYRGGLILIHVVDIRIALRKLFGKTDTKF